MGKATKMRRVGAARFTRDESGWWVATVAGLTANTQGRTLDQAEERLKEAVAVELDIEPDAVVFETTIVDLPKGVNKALRQAQVAAEAAEKQAKESEHATLQAAQMLAETGLSLRDAGKLLGLTRQRIHQILGAAEKS